MEYLVALTALFLTFHDATAVLPSAHYDVTEESSIGIFVGNVLNDAHLTTILGRDVVKDLRFRITDDGMEQLFAIDDVTGIILTRKVIDREIICPGPLMDNLCSLSFDVAATRSNPDYYDVIAVTITIIDVNDNIPLFPSKVHHIGIPESTNPPSTYTLPLAKDMDTLTHGIQSYTLDSNTDIFELNFIENAGMIRAVQLVLVKPVDREVTDSYELSLLANDGGLKPGVLRINITVSDANDHVPKFDKESYVIYIPENVPVSSTLLQVHATDSDIGANSKIVYSLAAASEMYGSQFQVDKNTGDITLTQALDFEVAQVYNLIIQAEDGGSNSQQAYCDVMINISDVNDEAPVISINTLAGKDKAIVSELAEPGQFVAHVSVKDLDTGAGGNFSCAVQNDGFELQKSSSNRFDLITTAPLDRELQENITIEVTCTDYGIPSLTSTKHLTVSIVDANDNPPAFEQNYYTFEIEENNLLNTPLFQVTTTDTDLGVNAEVSYFINGENSDWFTIDETGLIHANSVFDYESEHEVFFTVTAQDHGETPLSSTVSITLLIKDVNDEPPTFFQDTYHFNVKENQVPDTEIGRVIATDADSYPFNAVSYTLGVGSDVFGIDIQTGVIKTLRPLDREQFSRHTIEVIASNANVVPPLSSTVTVSIEVLNMNDNVPFVDFPSLNNDTVIISNMLPEGHFVTQIKGHDDDLDNVGHADDLEKQVGQGQRLHFSFLNSNDGYFRINRETGMIVIGRALDTIEFKTFELLVSVSDDGVPPLGTERVLKIVVDASVPFERKLPLGSNLLIVVILSASSFVIVLILITSIVYIKRRNLKKKELESSRYTIDFERSSDQRDHQIDLSVISTIMSETRTHDLDRDSAIVTSSRSSSHDAKSQRGSLSSYQQYSENGDRSGHKSSIGQHSGMGSRPIQQSTVLQCYDQRQRRVSDQDTDSAYSGELSNSDSGRGHSVDYHDCSYIYGSHMDKPVPQDNSETTYGYFDNNIMSIPQTISQMIQNNHKSVGNKTTHNAMEQLSQTHTDRRNTDVRQADRQMIVIAPLYHAQWKDTSFTDSNQSLDSGPGDDSSSTSGSYVIGLCDYEEEIIPQPVTV